MKAIKFSEDELAFMIQTVKDELAEAQNVVNQIQSVLTKLESDSTQHLMGDVAVADQPKKRGRKPKQAEAVEVPTETSTQVFTDDKKFKKEKSKKEKKAREKKVRKIAPPVVSENDVKQAAAEVVDSVPAAEPAPAVEKAPKPAPKPKAGKAKSAKKPAKEIKSKKAPVKKAPRVKSLNKITAEQFPTVSEDLPV